MIRMIEVYILVLKKKLYIYIYINDGINFDERTMSVFIFNRDIAREKTNRAYELNI